MALSKRTRSFSKMVSSQYFQVLKREKAKLVLENKENAAKFLDPEEKRRKADYGKNIKGNGFKGLT